MKPFTVSRRLPGPLALLAVTFLTGCAARPAVMGYYTKPSERPPINSWPRWPPTDPPFRLDLAAVSLSNTRTVQLQPEPAHQPVHQTTNSLKPM